MTERKLHNLTELPVVFKVLVLSKWCGEAGGRMAACVSWLVCSTSTQAFTGGGRTALSFVTWNSLPCQGYFGNADWGKVSGRHHRIPGVVTQHDTAEDAPPWLLPHSRSVYGGFVPRAFLFFCFANQYTSGGKGKKKRLFCNSDHFRELIYSVISKTVIWALMN